MSARSGLLSHDVSAGDDDSDEFEAPSAISHKLRRAVSAFNVKCYEEGTSFQWFDQLIQEPLDVKEVRKVHTKCCDICGRLPSQGEAYFT